MKMKLTGAREAFDMLQRGMPPEAIITFMSGNTVNPMLLQPQQSSQPFQQETQGTQQAPNVGKFVPVQPPVPTTPQTALLQANQEHGADQPQQTTIRKRQMMQMQRAQAQPMGTMHGTVANKEEDHGQGELFKAADQVLASAASAESPEQEPARKAAKTGHGEAAGKQQGKRCAACIKAHVSILDSMVELYTNELAEALHAPRPAARSKQLSGD